MQHTDNTENKAWYQHFWVWFIVVIPLLSMVLSFNMLYLATSTQDSLVVDDYYKQGKSINADLARQTRAHTLGVVAQLRVNDKQLVLDLASQQPLQLGALQLLFYHPTLSDRDFAINLLKDGQGQFRARLEHAISGKWRVTLQPLDKEWRLQRELALPNSSAIRFE